MGSNKSKEEITAPDHHPPHHHTHAIQPDGEILVYMISEKKKEHLLNGSSGLFAINRLIGYMCLPGILFYKGQRLNIFILWLATQTDFLTPWLKKDRILIERKNQTVEKVTVNQNRELYSYYELNGGKKHTIKISDN